MQRRQAKVQKTVPGYTHPPIKKNWLYEFEKPLLVTGLIVMIIIINYQTAFRNIISFLLDSSSSSGSFLGIISFETIKNMVGWAVWTEETSRYIFIWISYLAVSLSILNRAGIRIDVIHNALPAPAKRIVWMMIDLCTLILLAVLLNKGFEHVSMQHRMPQKTPALQINYFWPYLILPIGFGLMAIRQLQVLGRLFKELSIAEALIGGVSTILVFLPLIFGEHFSATALLFGYFTFFLLLGTPVAFSLGLSGLATVVGAQTLPLDYLAQISFTAVDSFPIMAIPFFIAAGVFMGAGGLSKRLLHLADELVGGLPGGMALATVVTSMFFAAISGSGPATVAAVGSITIPAMIARGYDKYFSAALVAAAGAVGVIIPPSNPFVVYGVSAQASIGKLFIAGIVPGLLMGFALMLCAYLISKRRGWKGSERKLTITSVLAALWDAKWALLVPVIVLGGIYGGFMTPTEAAAAAALYGLFAGIFIYRELSWKSFYSAAVESATTSSIIIVLIAMATIFGNIMTIEQIPETVADAILSLTDSRIIILLLINVFLLVVGIFMEALAAIVILTPILLPLVVAVGVDPVHFGVIVVMNLAIGFITPPVGVNLFVASGIANVSIAQVARAALIFLAVMIVILGFVTYIPEISMALVPGKL